MLTRASGTAERYRPHPEIAGAYLLDLPDRRVAVTFRREVLDAFAPKVRLLTYLTPELEELLGLAGADARLEDDGTFRVGGEAAASLDELEALLARES